MNSDDDIPVLRDAVSRQAAAAGLSREQIDEICDSLNAEAWVLIDKLLAETLREAEDLLRLRLNDRFSDEFPALIQKALQDKLGSPSDN